MSSPSLEKITVGIDLGTSAVKVVALSEDNRVVAEGTSGFQTTGSLPRQAEQQPMDWLRAVSIAMGQLRQTLPRTLGQDWAFRVDAIGLTGQLPSLVCLANDGPVGPAIIWKDGRADEWAAKKLDATQRKAIYSQTGMPIDGRYLAPMLEYHFADRLGEVHSVLSAKDYLLFELTGLSLTEPSTAAGYGTYDLQAGAFSAELCAFWHLPMNLLPAVRPANSLAGPLNAVGAKLLGLPAGIPVSMGAADSVCASYAMCGLDPGVVSISLGSSAVILSSTGEPRLDGASRYLLTPHVQHGWYGREMDLLASGTGYRWLSDLFSWQPGDLDRFAATSIPGARGLCFTPYLAGGEQGALWNPKLRSAISGLGLQHSSADIARAFLEGVFFEIRRCIEVLAETAPVDSVIVSGNITRSTSSTQMLADILQRPVSGFLEVSPAAIGAALKAREMTGVAVRPIAAQARVAGFSRAGAGVTSAAYEAIYLRYLSQSALCG